MGAPKSLEELFEQLRTERPTVADFLIIQLLTKPDDKATQKMIEQEPQVGELSDMLIAALHGNDVDSVNASIAILAFRTLIAAENEGDREEVVRQAQVLLKNIDAGVYPRTWANAQIKLGGALAVQSKSAGSARNEMLRSAIGHLNDALKVFDDGRSDQRGLIHYNLALAHHTLWQAQDDWEDEGDDKAAALQHGLAAIDLMDAGMFRGDRVTLTQYMIDLATSEGPPTYKQRDARALITKLIRGLLASPEAKELEKTARRHLQEALASLKEPK